MVSYLSRVYPGKQVIAITPRHTMATFNAFDAVFISFVLFRQDLGSSQIPRAIPMSLKSRTGIPLNVASRISLQAQPFGLAKYAKSTSRSRTFLLSKVTVSLGMPPISHGTTVLYI